MAAPKPKKTSYRNYSKPIHPTVLLAIQAKHNDLDDREAAIVQSVPLRGTDVWRERELVRVKCGAHLISVGEF